MLKEKGWASADSFPLWCSGVRSTPFTHKLCIAGQLCTAQTKVLTFHSSKLSSSNLLWEIRPPVETHPAKWCFWPRSLQRQKVASFCELLLMHVVWMRHSSHWFSLLNGAFDKSRTISMLFIYMAIINYKALNPHFSQPWEKQTNKKVFLFSSFLSCQPVHFFETPNTQKPTRTHTPYLL